MNAVAIVQAYHRATEQGDWKSLDALLAEDFIFSGPTAQPLGKRPLISSMKALWAAFPDVSFNLTITEEKDNVVKGFSCITGTHTGTLIPPLPGKFMSIKPTGKKIALAEEPSVYTLRNGQLIKQEVEPRRDGGWPGIFKQLGLEYPFSMP